MTNKNQVLIKTPQFKRGLKSVLETRLVQTDLGILLAGEPAFETDTGQLKIGNGKDPYKDLPYVGGVSQEYLNKINQNAVDIKSIDSRLSVLEAIKHHEHENKSELDKIIIGDVEKWNSLKNYDDSEIKALINTKADSEAVTAALEKKVNTSALESYYTKEETAALIKVNADAIAILVGDGDGSITKQIAEAITKVVANAPEELDTLKEIADYIASDVTGTAELLNKVASNTQAITAIEEAYKEKDAEFVAETERLAGLIQNNFNDIAILKGNGDGSINKKVADAIGAIPAATKSILGLVKIGETLSVTEDGTINVSKVSTDLLEQGKEELVLLGGSAGYSVN